MTTCDHCDQPAVFHDVRIENKITTTIHLCNEHAIAAGYTLGQVDLSVVVQLPHQIGELVPGTACPDCGMTLLDYKRINLLGCPTCYVTFAKQLKHVIANVQDKRTQHIGRAPSQAGETLDRHLMIRRLLKQLEAAVTQEEYEQAAILRDQLRDLHDSGEHNEN